MGDDDGQRCCPACGADALRVAGGGCRRVCVHCGSCWSSQWSEVDTLVCPGCLERVVCESRPTWLVAAESHDELLPDGARLRIRPVLPADRAELDAGYQALSARSRHLRFFATPARLGPHDLEYLTNVDQRDHVALAAFLPDLPTPSGAGTHDGLGVGVARCVRIPGTDTAEIAVTVLDAHQRRGIATALLRRLMSTAARRGVRSFVSYVLWENEDTIALLRAAGGDVAPDEPGVARVEIALDHAR